MDWIFDIRAYEFGMGILSVLKRNNYRDMVTKLSEGGEKWSR